MNYLDCELDDVSFRAVTQTANCYPQWSPQRVLLILIKAPSPERTQFRSSTRNVLLIKTSTTPPCPVPVVVGGSLTLLVCTKMKMMPWFKTGNIFPHTEPKVSLTALLTWEVKTLHWLPQLFPLSPATIIPAALTLKKRLSGERNHCFLAYEW